MKTLLILLCSLGLAGAALKSPIRNGTLETPLDGAGQSITNLGSLSVTNLLDAATGLPLSTGGAGGMAVAAGTNLVATTNGSLVTLSATTDAAAVAAIARANTNGLQGALGYVPVNPSSLGTAAYSNSTAFDSAGAAATAQAASLPLHGKADTAGIADHATTWDVGPDGSLAVSDGYWWLTNGVFALPGFTLKADGFSGDGSKLTGLQQSQIPNLQADIAGRQGTNAALDKLIAGNGSSLTNLPASSLTGTLPQGVLPTIPFAKMDYSSTNTVTTNAVALKVPVLTNAANVVYYMILFTNVP